MHTGHYQLTGGGIITGGVVVPVPGSVGGNTGGVGGSTGFGSVGGGIIGVWSVVVAVLSIGATAVGTGASGTATRWFASHAATAATPSSQDAYVCVEVPVLPTFPGLNVVTATP